MSRIPVTTNHALEFYQRRKYSNLILKRLDHEPTLKKILSVLDVISYNIRELEIGVDRFTGSDVLKYVLYSFTKLKSFKIYPEIPFYNNRFSKVDKSIDLPMLTLEYFEVVGVIFTLHIFSISSIKELNLKFENEVKFNEIEMFHRFLREQARLESLRLENFNGDFIITTGIKFKLRKLEIVSCNNLMTPQFYDFFTLHRNSLISFKINDLRNYEIINLLSAFESLRELDLEINLNDIQHQVLDNMLNIKDLKLNVINDKNYNLVNFLHHFPNLTSLNLNNLHNFEIHRLPQLVNLRMVNCLYNIHKCNKNIQKLILINCTLISHNLQIPNKGLALGPKEVNNLRESLLRDLPALKELELYEITKECELPYWLLSFSDLDDFFLNNFVKIGTFSILFEFC